MTHWLLLLATTIFPWLMCTPVVLLFLCCAAYVFTKALRYLISLLSFYDKDGK